MIDLKVTAIGGPEIAAKFAEADGGVRKVLRDELAIIGDEIVARASAAAPKRTGLMASKIVWFFGREFRRGRGRQRRAQVVEYEKDPRIFFTARPRGRIAHLVERGVNATFEQRTGRGDNPGKTYSRSLQIPPRPFFMPAVESVGGSAGVNMRLQARLDQLTKELNG